jgi:hypothetical protein
MQSRVTLASGIAVARFLHTTLIEHPPIEHAVSFPAERGTMRLGQYLLWLGYLTPQHLLQARSEQRALQQQNYNVLFGDILVRSQLIHPRVLTCVLLLQMVDRLLDPEWKPQMLGEQLIANGRLELSQLASAIQLQIWLRQSGNDVQLGDLLVEQQKISQQSLNSVLEKKENIYI